MAETGDSSSFPDHNPHLILSPGLSFDEFMNSSDLEGDRLGKTCTSKLDREWGYVYECHDLSSSPWKNDSIGGSSRYSSCCSAVSETLIGSKRPFMDVGNQQEETREANLVRKRHRYPQKLGDKSDGEEIASSESGSDESLSEPYAYACEEKGEASFQLPKIGMVFSSEEQAYKFYKNYAGGIGFTVRKGKVQRLANGTIRKRYFFCSRQGFRSKKQHDKKTKYKRKETRTGCEAQIQFVVGNGNWVISDVTLEHNHDLESPIRRGKTDSCTKISKADSITHTTINEAGTVNEAGNANSVPFLNMDCSNYLHHKKIHSLLPEDGQNLLNYLKHLQMADPSFFYSVQLDAESRVANFFWRDGRSRIDYGHFGDILILDTTFRMSIYDMICAPFWGVNHHRQYILFGCAFLLDESLESLIWLLGTFMEAMDRCQPKTILTDESETMENAIKGMLPETQHSLSTWHICQNARKHLSAYFEQGDFESLFTKCIFDCQSEEEFESMWVSLLEQHSLHENAWLSTIHMLRDKWSPLFCRKIFSAGVQSNYRSKNINNVFRNLANEIMTLPKFVQQYEKAAEQRRREELYEDVNCNGNASALILRSNAMEEQAANIYTPTMFKIFQGELLGCLSVGMEEIANDGSRIAKFKLTEGHKKENLVEFNCLDSKVTCSCGKFESFGILCAHALKVLNVKNVFHIPPQYVLKRWTKSAKGPVEDDHGAEMADKSQRSLSLYTSKLMHKALHVIRKSVPLKESRKIAEDCLDMTLKRVEDLLKAENNGHLNKRDVELDCGDNAGDASGIGTGSMGTQNMILNSPCVDPEEESREEMRSQREKRCNNEVRGTESDSRDDAIGHCQPPQKQTKGADEGSSGGFSHSVLEQQQQQLVQYCSDDVLKRGRMRMMDRLGQDGRPLCRIPCPPTTFEVMMQQRKKRRILATREAVMRRQKHLDDLMAQVAQFRKENNQIMTSINGTVQDLFNVEAENFILRDQRAELSQRLQSLNEIINCISPNTGAFETVNKT